MTVSAVSRRGVSDNEIPRVHVARIDIPEHWRAVVVLPSDPVRTEESRKVLPSHYSRSDVVENLQHCSLLVAAFASGNSDFLRAAMCDRLHQPYRSAICPLLRALQPLEAIQGVLGVALSGAGPGMLLIVERELDSETLERLLQQTLAGTVRVEVLQCGFESAGAGSRASSETRVSFAKDLKPRLQKVT
jgi:homoserine kinase